jgi:hypothetical protein
MTPRRDQPGEDVHCLGAPQINRTSIGSRLLLLQGVPHEDRNHFAQPHQQRLCLPEGGPVSESLPSTERLMPGESSAVELTDSQKLHLRGGIKYIDQLLQDIENILHTAESKSPFPRYQIDLSPAQGLVLEEHIRDFRVQLVRTLAWQKIDPPAPDVPASRAIATRIHFIDNALADLRPREMRGSGSLSEEAAAELSAALHELSCLAETMMNYIQVLPTGENDASANKYEDTKGV